MRRPLRPSRVWASRRLSDDDARNARCSQFRPPAYVHTVAVLRKKSDVYQGAEDGLAQNRIDATEALDLCRAQAQRWQLRIFRSQAVNEWNHAGWAINHLIITSPRRGHQRAVGILSERAVMRSRARIHKRCESSSREAASSERCTARGTTCL
jgi:hypothetical protein